MLKVEGFALCRILANPAVPDSPPVEGYAAGGGWLAAVAQTKPVPVCDTTPSGYACHPFIEGNFEQQRHAGLCLPLIQLA